MTDNRNMRQDWIKERLSKIGKNQTELGNAIGLTQKQVSEIVTGIRALKLTEAKPLAEFLGVDITEVLARTSGEAVVSTPTQNYNDKERISPQNTNLGDDTVLVVEIAVGASTGGGTMVVDEPEKGYWGFPADWVRIELQASPEDLRVITVNGDSMEGILRSGDKIVVNTSMKQPSPPGIFVLFDGMGLVAKRLEVVDGSDTPTVRISSSNPSYPAYERTADEVNIVGRVMGRWERL